MIFRIAQVKSTKSGRMVLVRVTRQGTLSGWDATVAGKKSLTTWREVEAETWAEATEKFADGQKVVYDKRYGTTRKVTESKGQPAAMADAS